MYNANWQFRATLTILLGISSNPQGNISLIMIYGCVRSNGWCEITRYVMFYNKQWHFAGIVLICANKSLIWWPPCSKPSMNCNAIIYPFSNAFCASALRCRRHCVFRVIRPSQRFLSVTLRKHRSNNLNFGASWRRRNFDLTLPVKFWISVSAIYPTKYAHDFVCLCFVLFRSITWRGVMLYIYQSPLGLLCHQSYDYPRSLKVVTIEYMVKLKSVEIE